MDRGGTGRLQQRQVVTQTKRYAFDGSLTEIIYVAEGITELERENSICTLRGKSGRSIFNRKRAQPPIAWAKAFTAVGGDPITQTVRTLGTTYFLENGWRIQPASSGTSYTLTINGNIYTREAGETPFRFANGVSVSLVRSNIVDLITVEALAVAITEADIDNISNAAADKVWDELLTDHQIEGSAGKKLKDNIKKNQYIALS